VAKPCTNDTPCGRAAGAPAKAFHSAVCRKLADQGLTRAVRREASREDVTFIAELKGVELPKMAMFADGSVVVAQKDAEPILVRAGEKLDLSPGAVNYASPDRRVGCGCGEVALTPEGWRGVANDWEQDGVMHRRNRTCYPIPAGEERLPAHLSPGTVAPERAGREGDQALPVVGASSVFAEVRRRLDEREATGVRRYGRSLETFNGRDACRDLEDELLDGLAYATQVRIEHHAIVEALMVLASAVRRLRPALSPPERAAVDLAEKLEATRGR
jgi:hypothetical protein